MEKKLTNHGPLREPANKHSIYTPDPAQYGNALKRAVEIPILSDDRVWRHGRHIGGMFPSTAVYLGLCPVSRTTATDLEGL